MPGYPGMGADRIRIFLAPSPCAPMPLALAQLKAGICCLPPPPPAQAYSCRESLSLPSLLIMTCASPSCLWLGTVPRIMHLRPGPVTAGSLLFLGWPSIFQRGGSPLHGWIRGNRENSPPAQMLPGRHVADEFSHTHRSAHRNALLPPVLSSPLPPTRIL